MGIEINLSGMKIGDNVRLLNDASIRGDGEVSLRLESLELSGQAAILDNLQIDSVLEELGKRVLQMDKDSDEYLRIQEILKRKQWKKENFINCVLKHVSDFSQGVLASVVANFLTTM